MSRSSDGFRTRDLTLAAHLSLLGYDYRLEREGESGTGHPIGVWVFNPADDLDNAIRSFELRTARVEPVRFMRCLTTTRRELLDFLGVKRGR